jgi:hypothetical protein
MKTRRGARNSSFPLPLLLHNGGAVFQCWKTNTASRFRELSYGSSPHVDTNIFVFTFFLLFSSLLLAFLLALFTYTSPSKHIGYTHFPCFILPRTSLLRPLLLSFLSLFGCNTDVLCSRVSLPLINSLPTKIIVKTSEKVSAGCTHFESAENVCKWE